MELWERIVKANNEIKTITLKGKEYCEVKERILAFRKVYPSGCIITEPTFTDNYIMVKATITTGITTDVYKIDENGAPQFADGVLATGHARELANRPFALENAETSAIGRAISIATGLGVSTSLSSFEDMQNYEDSKIFDDEQMELEKKRREEATIKFNKLSATQKASILNLFPKQDVSTMNIDILEEVLRNIK